MTDHIHWDIPSIEAKMRADLATIKAMGDQAVKDGSDPQFIAAQREFDEARLQYALACMKAENRGIGRNELLSGAGYTLGTIWASMLSSCVGARERAVFNGWVQHGLMQGIGVSAAKKTMESVFKPQEAGHA